MQYCLPAAEALPLAAQILESMLPGDGYAGSFAAALVTAARATQH
jgi:hypothetical protein